MQSVHINCLELQVVSLALKTFSALSEKAACSGQNGQHHSSGIYQQTRGAAFMSSALVNY